MTARGFVGVPYRHLGREAARGLDCYGVIVAANVAVGLPGHDLKSYGARPSTGLLKGWMAAHYHTLAMAEAGHGDILAFRGNDRIPCHLGILATDGPAPTLIHAWPELGRVCEHDVAGPWGRAVAVYSHWRA